MARMKRVVEFVVRVMALVGGAVLIGLALLTCLSVLGRSLGGLSHSPLIDSRMPGLGAAIDQLGFGPINGDFEILEAGIAFCIFAFLPVCQWHGAHARVDVFTRGLPDGLNRALSAFWEVVLAGMLILISWRLFAGLQGKWQNGETTFMLQFPVWWSYAASFAASALAVLVAVYCAVARVVALVATDRVACLPLQNELPPELSTDHSPERSPEHPTGTATPASQGDTR